MSEVHYCCNKAMKYIGLSSYGDGDLTEEFHCSKCHNTLRVSYYDDGCETWKEESWEEDVGCICNDLSYEEFLKLKKS